MSRALWLADALRAEGLVVVEEPGWQTAGSSVIDPKVIVCHHTASASGDAPSLTIVRNGRSDLPGPLCNVLLARSGVAHVIASGRSNNAGLGSWNGITGNSSTLGIEAENNGVGEPWPAAQKYAYVRICAAMCRQTGIPVGNVIGHKEWAPRRKIDPTFDMTDFRTQVALRLAGQLPPSPKPEPKDDELMPRAFRSRRSGATYIVDPGPKTRWKITSSEFLQELYVLELIYKDKDNVPAEVSGEFLDRFASLDK